MKMKCVSCGTENIVKRGIRENKREKVQLYKCKDCGKVFNDNKLKNKSYNVNVILNALSYYNKGYTFEESARLVNKRFKVNVSPQLVHSWLKEYKELCSFSRFRNNVKDQDMIYSRLFNHKQPYLFKYHKFKVNNLVNDYFKGVNHYLVERVKDCPNSLFVSSNLRSSQFRISLDKIKKVKIIKSKNKACLLSELALKAAKTNKERHSVVQEFMLVNDSVTLAVEVPIWLCKKEIESDDILQGVLGVDSDITGHIDILQNKFGMIHVLDYKPNASSENLVKVVSQLFIYAVALSVRTGVWLRNFRCGWFDNDSYFEFNPNYIIIDYLKKNNVKDHGVWKKYWSDLIKHEKAVNLRFKAKSLVRFFGSYHEFLIRSISRIFDIFEMIFLLVRDGFSEFFVREEINGC